MAIFQEKIVLINHHGIKLAEYPATQVSFCGKSPDNKQFFGLVTTRKMEDEEAFSSSCHVFMTEAVTTGEEVQRRASAFQFEPTKTDDPDNNDEYKEFPTTADPIIGMHSFIDLILFLEGFVPENLNYLKQIPEWITIFSFIKELFAMCFRARKCIEI